MVKFILLAQIEFQKKIGLEGKFQARSKKINSEMNKKPLNYLRVFSLFVQIIFSVVFQVINMDNPCSAFARGF